MRVEPAPNTYWSEIDISCKLCTRKLIQNHGQEVIICSTKTCPNYMYSMTNKGDRDVRLVGYNPT